MTTFGYLLLGWIGGVLTTLGAIVALGYAMFQMAQVADDIADE